MKMNKEKESYEPKVMVDTKKENPDVCVCPECGHEVSKRKGLSCRSMKCPICDTMLVGKK
jgi:hypothetical protein